MKKIFILLLSLSFIGAKAQLALSNFNSAGLNGWTMINDANIPSAATWNATYIAKWQANAFVKVPVATGDSALLACAVFSPAAPPDRWLISPSFTVNNANQFFLFDHYGSLSGETNNEEFEILVSPTAGTTKASFTASIATLTNSTASRTLSAKIGTYNGQTIRVAIRYKSPNGYLAYLDNFRTRDLPNADGRMVSVSPALNSFSSFVPVGSTVNISGVVQNLGASAVTDYNVYYQVDNNTPVSQNVTPFFFSPYETDQVNFTVPYTVATAGKKNIKVWISIVGDTSRANDTLKTSITGVTTMSNRIPLFEVFTSSTCGPCTPGNENLHSIIDTKDSNTFNVVKYQQDFPSTGDPYATVETVNRRGWYAISSIPRMEIDGGWDGNASSFNETLFSNAINTKTFINLSGTYDLDTAAKKITIAMDIKSLADLNSNEYRVIYAIVERVTVKNKKTNGETSFTQVVKKLIPNENGALIETISPTLLTANTTFKHNTVFTLPGAYRLPANGTSANQIKLATEHSVENFNNLYVVAWVESKTEKVVLQSAKLSKFVAGTATLDSFHEKVTSIATVVDSAKVINGTFDLLKDTTYVWNVPSATVSLPSTWSFLSLCDNFNCYYAPIITQEFKGKTLKADNPIKVEIKHNKKAGYGSIIVELWKKSNKTGTIKSYKYSLLTTTAASISLLSDVNEKLLYYFDNKIFVDRDFKNAQLQVVDINGRQIIDTKVSSDNIDFTPISSGIFIATVIKDGQVAKTIKFSTAK